MAQLEDILQALKCATSQDPSVLKPAEVWLREKESDGSFYVSLSEICRKYDIDWTVRWMAVVCLKNGIDRFWRTHTANTLAPENKAKIRENISSCLEEPMHQIATQCAVVIAKIGRFDYPAEWNELIPFLLSGVSSPRSVLHQNRCLLVLKQVIKTLSLKKLPHAKQTFTKLCRSIFGDIFQYWIASHGALKCGSQEEPENRERITDSFKENHFHLTHIIEYTMQDYGSELIKNIHDVVLKNLSEAICMAQQCKSFDNLSEFFLKTAVITVKILDNLLNVSVESYDIGAQRAMSLLCDQIQTYTFTPTADELTEKFVVKCMNLCKAVLDSDNFFDAFLGSGVNFFSISPALETLFQCLVCHYLPLKQEDLASWEDGAEEFSNEEVGESWKFNLRPSAEVLALTLLKKFPDLLVPCLLKMLEVVQDLDVHNISSKLMETNPALQIIFKGCKTPFECMVRKEAVYYMVGLGVYEVFQTINFEDWLMKKLLPEVKANQGEVHGKLIHRRVLWLISQWSEIKPSDELKPILYEFVVASLGKSFDMVVRLTATSTVQYLLDDFEFDITQFQLHQDSCFQGLFDLLMDTTSCDTKMRILNVFTYLIERLGKLVLPYESKISGIVPPLWDHAVKENHDMLKCAIMGTVVQFIFALKEKSTVISHLTLPLIQESTDLNNTSHVYLLVDGLDLWLATVQNCPEPNEALFGLFNNIFGLLEYGSETLKTCFAIIEAYVLLYHDALLSCYGDLLDTSFTSLATDVRNECLVLISKLVSNMVEIIPDKANLPCTGYCKAAFKLVFSDRDCVLVAANFSLAAQMVIKNVSQFFQLFQHLSQETGEDLNGMLQGFIKIWCDSIDTIVEIDKKKLSALALLILSSSLPEIPAVGHSFSAIVCAVVQVFFDVCDENHVDMLLNEAENEDFGSNPEGEECQHDKRRRLLRKKSPALSVSLPAFASEKFKFLRERVSEQNFSQLISSVNAETVNELQNFLSAF